MQSVLLGLCLFISFLNIGVAATSKDYDAILAKYIDTQGPGVAAIVTKNGQTLYLGTRGMANVELGVPLKDDSVFRLGSITKQFTAAAIMLLQEQGRLSVSDNIHKYVPDFPTEGNTVTIKHLLTHTSGIANYTEDQDIWNKHLKTPTTLDDMLKMFAKHPMALKTGEQNRYSNTGYVLLGKIIEVASGEKYADFIEKHIFAKLGMKNSRYGGNQLIPNRVSGYSMTDKGLENAGHVDMMWPHAAGSLLSTVDDLGIWFNALTNGKFISKDSYHQMIQPFKLDDGTFAQYGYGLGLFRFNKYKAIGHGGGIHGFVTNAFYVPDEDLYVAVLQNLDSGSPGDIARLLAATALNLDVPEFKTADVDESILRPLMGTYYVDENSKRKISLENGQVFSQRDDGQKWKIYPLSENSFYYEGSLSYFSIDTNDKGQSIMNFYHGLSLEPEVATKK
ncbi:serine hydrolase domain-containing protein [Colwelliaceae bacterium 6471]